LHSPETHLIGALAGQNICLIYLHSNIFLTQIPESHKIGEVMGHYLIYWHFEKSDTHYKLGHLIGFDAGHACYTRQ